MQMQYLIDQIDQKMIWKFYVRVKFEGLIID